MTEKDHNWAALDPDDGPAVSDSDSSLTEQHIEDPET